MIECLAAAANALEGHELLDDYSGLYSLLSVIGWVFLHAFLPVIGGVIYALHWRALLIWVVALAVASFAIHAGQELWNAAHYDDYRTASGVLMEVATFIFVPALASAGIGIFIRKMWDRFRASIAVAEVQE